jgi:hypothetical protein
MKKDYPDELCPKTFEGTSKAMEGHGAVVNTKWLYAQRVIINELVMDDYGIPNFENRKSGNQGHQHAAKLP